MVNEQNENATQETAEVESDANVLTYDQIKDAGAYKGLHSSKERYKTRAQKAEAELAVLKEQQDKAANVQPIEEEMPDDELVTQADLKKARAKEDEARQKQENQIQNKRMLDSEASAKARLTIANCGEGLDYETVTSEGQQHLTKGDYINIQTAVDPGQEAYDTCIRRSATLRGRMDKRTQGSLLQKWQSEESGKNSQDGSRAMSDKEYERLAFGDDVTDSQMDAMLEDSCDDDSMLSDAR